MRPGPAPHLWRASERIEVAPTTWAYVAGLFDGEGTLSSPFLSTSKKRQYVGWRIAIAQLADTGLCEWIREVLGCGTITTHQGPRPRPVANWRVNRQLDVLYVLGGVRPYVRVKQEGVEIAYNHLLATCMKWAEVE